MAELGSILELVGQIERAVSERIQNEIRATYGGTRVMISRREPISRAKIESLAADRVPVRTIAKKLGFDRATVYRHLNKRGD